MRRWSIVTAIVLISAIVACGVLWFGLRSPASHDREPRITAIGLLLLDDAEGLYVLGVSDGGLASDAGIQPGDYLTMAKGTALTTAAQLEALLDEMDEKTVLPITLDRRNQTITVNLAIR